jgi:hypothetical protein
MMSEDLETITNTYSNISNLWIYLL